MMERFMSLIGLLVMILIAYGLSSNRRMINWRTILSGLFLQLALGVLILKTSGGRALFDGARRAFESVLGFTNQGSEFIFGSLVDPTRFGFIFFTMVLPTILFMSALMSILYHLGVMQVLIRFVAKVMVKVMGTSGSESLAAAANIFAGQTEAPLVVKPLIGKMTQSELLALMTGGMATVAGGVLAAYVGFGIDGGHLLAASVMSAPAALVCSKLLLPECETSQTDGDLKVSLDQGTVNLIDAASQGAAEGLKLALNVGAMLLVFIALIAMINGILGLLGGVIGFPELSLEWFMGLAFAPLAFLMGVPWSEAPQVGVLLGKKLIINEFVAYLDLKDMMGTLSERSVIISTYALCGFANFSSIAIQVGGIGTLAPERRQDLARLGIKSLIGGTLACLMTACIAGLLL
jgi:concentrative nucleoside transporter, CNT family